jgi:hypothetical protein
MSGRLRMLLGMLAHPRRARRPSWLGLVANVVYTVMTAGLLLAAIGIVWHSWTSGGLLSTDVNDISGLLVPFIQVLLARSALTTTFSAYADIRTTATALLRAAADRDATIAPAAIAETSEAVDTRGFRVPALPDAAVTVVFPEALTTRGLAIGGALVASVFVALPSIIIATLALPVTPNFPASALADWGTLALTMTALVCAIFSAWLFIVAVRSLRRRQRQRRGFEITTATDGLRFRRPESPRRERFIAWSAAQSLTRIDFTDTLTRHRAIYLLDAGQETLLWEAPPIERYGAPDTQQHSAILQDNARQLAAQIAARSGLPLLDLTGASASLLGTTTGATTRSTTYSPITTAYYAAVNEHDTVAAQAIWPALDLATQSSLRMLRRAPDTEATGKRAEAVQRRVAFIDHMKPNASQQRLELLRYMLALLPYYPGQAHADQLSLAAQSALRRERGRQRLNQFLTNVQLATLLLSVVVGVLFWLSGSYIDNAKQAMPVRVRQESPLYSTSFRYPDGVWTTRAPTKTDTSSLGVVNGAYQISGSDPNYSVIGNTSVINMRDGAEQVTVSETGKADENNLAWVGLIFDANADGSKFSTFMIDELGDWSLSHYDSSLPSAQQWSTPDAGFSDAIHTGQGVSNTLLLVRQRNFYLLYINGSLVDGFTDQSHALAPGGWVGVYLDEGGFVARFTNFSVSAVPSPLPTWLPGWLATWLGA